MTFNISVCGFVYTVSDPKWIFQRFLEDENEILVLEKSSCFKAAPSCGCMNQLAAPAAMRSRY